MKFSTFSSLLALATYAGAAPEKLDVADQFAQQALSAHNSVRRRYGARPLRYDYDLASGAASYAARCHWGHSHGNYGENLYSDTDPDHDVQDAVYDWVAESSKYSCKQSQINYMSYNGNHNRPSFSLATGHFTQVVWKDTVAVGCGVRRCTTGSPLRSRSWTYIVCRYSPPGNVFGHFAENVGRLN